ncbi:acetylornithine transaminase [Corynebacterium macginleyi]|uniref:acetylornithine transaminase n=1 Tax=Corynebacterium macginleyi TaxID=38290 RepID=UPI001909BCFC|nr:acetylornithine transaminase [Corynebacterium macginleyi]MBK4137309.1 acetylornithine transaminase [Corynebacterium macginleyi]MBK4142863.1 acetylornithine transaminase [Corynebacterium macginleyi]MBK4144449.1 acetylornithine transaminase [Corynebacterium macginleyi]MBK4152234.1 acetylornithine transaminase [Corynebacterium macginleyi]QRJ56971.1 acetylornithine transaminase [Corynebacterium macginleyi]
MHAQETLTGRWSKTLANTYGQPPLGLVSGQGATLTGEDGKTYIDLLAGIAVNSLGYGNAEVANAVAQQSHTLVHTSNLFATQPVLDAGAKLIERVGDSDARVFFCNSGSEANEAAFKLARLTGRRRILAANHGFHGRTMGSLAMTGQPEKQDAFRPLPSGVEFYPYGNIDYLRQLVEQDAADTAAIIFEPIQGETGVIPAPAGFMQAISDLCDEYGILLIVDEIQSGAGRTGQFFAHELEGISPDVITMAKGLGSGLPIGATITRGRAKDLFQPGSHGTTFGGNPVACAAANVVLDTLDESFLREVSTKGEYLARELNNIPGVRQVRGRGLMLGVVLSAPVARQAVMGGFELGIILNAPSENVLRLTPPLIISQQEIDVALEKLRTIVKELV